MCGILGLISISDQKKELFDRFDEALAALNHRGSDAQKAILQGNIALGHTRLSIIDLDSRSNQPMTDRSGRYTIVFNGEIYNYKELKQECEQAGFTFHTQSDTEVLLLLFMRLGKGCLEKLNGFFAFAVYDRKEISLFVARDRVGIKPLVYYADANTFAFASELKALIQLNFSREIDKVSVFTLFKLNYLPAPATILKNHFKLEPGHFLEIKWDEEDLKWSKETWYKIPYDAENEKDLNPKDYQKSKAKLKKLVRESVQKRLVADVPIGTFLSGGIDSSIITAIAKEEKNDIAAYSIGFPENLFFDESNHARQVSKHLGVEHHVFDITKKDMLQSVEDLLEHLDEPFGDSSIINVHVLSQKVRPFVRVALSGDGGDELFGGYHKHGAEFNLRYPGVREHIVGSLHWLWNHLPASRNGRIPNLTRQLQKFSDGYQLGPKDRYWRWAGILTEEQANYLMTEKMLPREHRLSDDGHVYKKRKDHFLRSITKNGTLNEVLLTDTRLVLSNDILFKVDQASMMHNLEVRTPLLDHAIIKFAFELPVMFKVNHKVKKKILQDSFSNMLPSEVFNRAKRGFEVPLLSWFQCELKERFLALISDKDFNAYQGIFNQKALDELQLKLYSANTGNSASTAWTFLVFQTWYKRNMC
jgi:asparagine synthase (glutamine-hydrolysing)